MKKKKIKKNKVSYDASKGCQSLESYLEEQEKGDENKIENEKEVC